MKKLLLISLITLLTFSLKAQNTTLPDSLLTKAYEELEDLFYDTKPDTLKCTLIADKYFLKAKKKNNLYEMVIGKYYLADIKDNPNIYLTYVDSLINVTKKRPTKLYPSALYFNKGMYFFNKYEDTKAFEQFLKTNNYSILHKNDSLNAISCLYLGLIKNNSKDYSASLLYNKRANEYFKNRKSSVAKSYFLNTLMNIAQIHLSLNQLDSASIYINSAKDFSYIEQTSQKFHISYVEGNILFTNKEYKKAIVVYESIVNDLKNDKSYDLLSNIYSKTGICYDSINKLEKALQYHLKVDSLHKKDIKSLKTTDSFQFLANHYKNRNNLEKQLEYINKLILEKEFSSKEYSINEYDIPNLEKEKILIEERLYNEQRKHKKSIIIFIIMALLIISLLTYLVKKRYS